MKISKRIAALRIEMQKHNIDAFYISGTDSHSSEYLPERWKTRAFISGFTGSYGIVVISQTDAALWTDTRYFLQAEEQLKDTGIGMKKLRVSDSVLPEVWLSEKLKNGSRVGIDAQTITVNSFRNLENMLALKKIEVVQTPDLFNEIWQNRPLIPDDKIFDFGLEYAGVSRSEKQGIIVNELEKIGADFAVVTMLDELAWLLNLRGSDIDYNPVFTGYAIVGKNINILFVESNKIPENLRLKLEGNGLELKEYDQFYSFLNETKSKTIFIDSSTCNYSVYTSLAKNNKVVEGTSILSILKARKNKVEIEGFKKAMKKDGVALVEFLYWLKTNIGKAKITEFDIGKKLKEFRAKQEGFILESFPPIVGYKNHGAIVHLSVGAENALPVEADGILLFDSGGQYFNGTTDITRTIALGAVSAQQKRDYTVVLKGMIALTKAKFPVGTKGCNLDVLARKPLWENGMNYGHGTGHGVGHFLNVHEGPMAIRQEYNENCIEPGHVLSNEPAFYREGEYGIRTENMMVCVEKEDTLFGRFLGFETLTLCPIDVTLIEVELLSDEEKYWLNTYHKKVNEKLKPLLNSHLHKFIDDLTLEI